MQWPWRNTGNDLDLEVQHHLQSLADEFERQGVRRHEALQRARREFGGVDKFTEETRDEHRFGWLADLAGDVTFGWRMMKKAPS
ncbi:MAG: permease prefix domain 1-containing protein [Bryobacteraceae bacterium]